jgi:DNA-binding transcriptional LysR family regulator
MDTRDFRLLLALAEHRHFARAAEAMGISQPAFSTRLQALEHSLGVRLAERGARFERFTPDGEQVVARFREIMALMDGLTQGTGAGVSGELRIAVIPTQLQAAGELAAMLCLSHPSIRATIQSRSSKAIDAALDRYEADVGLSYVDETRPERYRVDPFRKETYVLVATPGLLAGAGMTSTGDLPWREAAGLPLGLLGRDMHNRRLVDEVFASAGVVPRVLIESDTFASLAAAASLGGLATILTARQAEMYAAGGGLMLRPLTEPAAESNVGLVSLRRDPDLPVVAAARDVLARLADR